LGKTSVQINELAEELFEFGSVNKEFLQQQLDEAAATARATSEIKRRREESFGEKARIQEARTEHTRERLERESFVTFEDKMLELERLAEQIEQQRERQLRELFFER